MKNIHFSLILAALLVSQTKAQQSPNLQPIQVQPPPCTNTSTTPNPSGNNAGYKVPNKWKQLLDTQRKKVEAATGISVPDPSADVQQAVNSRPAPCPPQAGSPKNPPPTPAPTLRLPADTTVTVTLHCNPMPPFANGASGHPTTLLLPDPHDFAIPKANEFEVDNVVPDLAAKTPCYLVKVDPKSGRSFVAAQ